MQIYVKTPRGKTLTFEVEGTHTVELLRALIARHGHPASRQRLFFCDDLGDHHELTDRTTLEQYRIKPHAELNLGLLPEPIVVKLNVGGKRKDTLLSTLTAVRGSYLCRQFEDLAQGGGAIAEAEPGGVLVDLAIDDAGAWMLDRDPKAFDYVLNYLRDKSAARAAARAAAGSAAIAAEPEPKSAACDEPEPELELELDQAQEPGGQESPQLASLRAELHSMRLTALKRRAAATGVDSRALWAADDADDIKGTIIDLIINTVGPPQIDLPSSNDDLRRLLIEAEQLELPELAGACRKRIQRDRQTAAAEHQLLRETLAAQCPAGLSDEACVAAVAEAEQMCEGAFSVQTIREQQQRIADSLLIQQAMARAAVAVKLRDSGISAAGARALANDWTGRYMEQDMIWKLAAMTDAEGARLGLDVDDVESVRAALPRRFDFQAVDNSDPANGKFDRNGLLYCLGTEGGKSEWVNPHTAGRDR